MEEIDPITGLPKSLGIHEQIDREQQKIKIRVVPRRFRKLITQISGFDSKEQAEKLGKVLKRKFACGGTTKDTVIELQGNHANKVKAVLLAEGYNEEFIDDQSRY